jgi:hypothetical protein
VSVSGGSFSAGRVFRGGAQAALPSSYYIGFWPCQQADGDADDEQVTDRSGNEAHMTLGSLTSTEAWASAGYVTSLDDANHAPIIPLANWTHRFTAGSLILAAQSNVTKEVAADQFFGNGAGSSQRGFALRCGTGGNIQPLLYTTTSVFGSGTTETPWATAVLRSWMFAFDYLTRAYYIFIDGAISSVNGGTFSAADLAAADASVIVGPALGGRTNFAAMAAKHRHCHALDLAGKGLPTNLAALAHRLHAHPRLMLRDADMVF